MAFYNFKLTCIVDATVQRSLLSSAWRGFPSGPFPFQYLESELFSVLWSLHIDYYRAAYNASAVNGALTLIPKHQSEKGCVFLVCYLHLIHHPNHFLARSSHTLGQKSGKDILLMENVKENT